MKLKYKIKYIIYNGKEDDIIFEFDEKYRILSTFLSADVQSFPDYIIEGLEKVLNGKSDYEELNGNVCGVEIHRDMTQIYDNLADDGMGNWCEIETKELRELVDIWCNELKKFKEQYK